MVTIDSTQNSGDKVKALRASDYAQATGYIRVIEKKILTSDGIERMIDINSADETLKALSQNSDFDFSAVKRPEDYEEVLKNHLKATYEMMYQLSPDVNLIEVLGLRYDFNNVKVALKSKYLGIQSDNIYITVTRIDPKDILNAVDTGSNPNLPVYILNAIKEAKDAYEVESDPQALDIVLDKAMFGQMLVFANNTKSDFIVEYAQVSVDLYNLKTLMRVKNMEKGSKFLSDSLVDGGIIPHKTFVEYYDKTTDVIVSSFYYKYFGDLVQEGMDSFEKVGNFSTLEKLADNSLINRIKSAKYTAFGPEPLFAYIVSRENEIRQVRLLLTCKINDIPPTALRERLRDNYA